MTTSKIANDNARAAAEANLVELRAKLRAALAEKKARLQEFVESCKADRRAIRDEVRALRSRSLRDLGDHVQAARGAAKLTRLTRLAEVRQSTSGAVERARALAVVERQHVAELAHIAQTERSRRVEIRLAHERAMAAGELRSVLFGKLSALFQREARSMPRAAGESRAEALLRFAERNAEKAHKAVEPKVHRRVEETQRAVGDAERAVRVAGGNPRALRSRGRGGALGMLPDLRSVAPGTGATPLQFHQGATPLASDPAAAVIAPTPQKVRRGRPPSKAPLPKKVKTVREKVASKRLKRHSHTPALPKPRPGSGKKRRLGDIRSQGMPLKDFLADKAQLAAKKAARGKGKTGKKPATHTAATAARPPAVASIDSNTTGRRALVTSRVVQSVKPFRVRASCGHIVVRPMREATAGVPYSPNVVLEAPRGRACEACEAKRGFGIHAPKPAPKNDVKAPELKDTAEIAGRIRSDIADAVRKKKLPKATYSVRTSKYSMGSEINVVASKLPFASLNPAAFRLPKGSSVMEFDRERFSTRYTSEAERVLATLTAIVDAYHWDRSDPATDYHHSRFSRDVGLDDAEEWKRINAAKIEAARAALTVGAAR